MPRAGAPSASVLSLAGVSQRLAFLDTQDFVGQVHAERFYQVTIAAAGAVGFLHGWAAQSFAISFYYWAAASLVAAVVSVPGWPWLFRRHGVQWLERVPAEDELEPLPAPAPADKGAKGAKGASGAGGAGGAATTANPKIAKR